MEHVCIPSTKANPVETEAFYAAILAHMTTRVVILEAHAKRADGLADLLAAVAEREEMSEENIHNLGEALMSLVNREARRVEREADDK